MLKLNQAVNGETINPRKIQIQRLLKLNRIIKLLWKLTAHYSNTTIVKVKSPHTHKNFIKCAIQIQRLLKLNCSSFDTTYPIPKIQIQRLLKLNSEFADWDIDLLKFKYNDC